MKTTESELVTKIAEAQIKRNAIFDDIESLKANEKAADAEIAALTQQLAEAKKPKLRHGELRIWRKEKAKMSSDLMVILDLTRTNHEGPMVIFKDSLNQPLCTHYSVERILDLSDHVCYPLDDLTALSEDVTEFEVDGTIFKLIGDKLDITNTNQCNARIFTSDEIDAIALGIRQMQATLKRGEKK